MTGVKDPYMFEIHALIRQHMQRCIVVFIQGESAASVTHLEKTTLHCDAVLCCCLLCHLFCEHS